MADAPARQVALLVKKALTGRYGQGIKQVLLYGSHVRGKATEDSDVDVLIVIDNSLDPFEVRRSVSDLLLDILLEEGLLVSVLAVPEHLYKNYNSPFLLMVREEGVAA